MGIRRTRRGLLQWAGLAGVAALLQACVRVPAGAVLSKPVLNSLDVHVTANVAAESIPTASPARAPARLPRVDVRLFGPLVLYRDGAIVPTSLRKVDRARELLALLILRAGGLANDAIAEMMWPGMQLDSARHNLQMAACSLRARLGSKVAVQYRAQSYTLNPELDLVSDVWNFDHALETARHAGGQAMVRSLSRAVKLYAGPLAADAGWDWLAPIRLEYRTRYVAAAVQLAEVLGGGSNA
jgi:DNA-binding SARP family transcriptional activator